MILFEFEYIIILENNLISSAALRDVMYSNLTDELLSCYEEAASLSSVSHVTLTIGNHIAYLSFAGKNLAPALMQSLEGIRVSNQETYQPDLRIFLWEGNAGLNFISAELKNELLHYRNKTTVIHAHKKFFQYNPEGKILSYIDIEQRIAFYFSPDVKNLPDYEICSPMLMIFNWFCRMNKMLLIHGAAVAWNGVGALLVGKGGAGKSTTALLSLLNGFDFIGDDYIAITTEGEVIGYPVYRGCKVTDATLQKLPQLLSCTIATNRTTPKNVLILNESIGKMH